MEPSSSTYSYSEVMNFMTFNLRYANAPDGEHAWQYRKDLVVDIIKRFQPAVLGTQEALKVQIDHIMTHLAPHYLWFGGCRFGTGKDEHCAVFYDARRVTLERNGDFWMSETPDVPGSKSWDSGLPRIVTWGKFRRKGLTPAGVPSNDVFYLFNTHLDYEGPKARVQGAGVILDKVREIVDKGDHDPMYNSPPPVVFLVGDFNSTRYEDPHLLLTGKVELDGRRGHFVDVWRTAKKHVNAVEHTRHDYRGSFLVDLKGSEHIDFIFYRPPMVQSDEAASEQGRNSEKPSISNAVKTEEARVIVDGNEDGRFPSDHFPVYAKIAF